MARPRRSPASAKDALSAALLHAHDHEQAAHAEEYRYYPAQWFEPYLGRRRRIGWDLYGLLGIGRTDKPACTASTGAITSSSTRRSA